MDNVQLALIPGIGMVVVGCAAALYWRAATRERFRWLWIGAGLWGVAVALKMAFALLVNGPIIGAMQEHLPYPLLVVCVGLYVGLESSLAEIGLTLVACLIWRQFGADAKRAIGIGVGAGAFEAILLGVASLISIIVLLAGVPGTEAIRNGIEAAAASTPVFWLAAPTERIVAILCHASSRALVLLGVTNRKPMMVFYGFLLFTLLDSVAGATQLSGKMGEISLWWIELAILPFAVISIPILKHCYTQWGHTEEKTPIAVDAP